MDNVCISRNELVTNHETVRRSHTANQRWSSVIKPHGFFDERLQMRKLLKIFHIMRVHFSYLIENFFGLMWIAS